MRGYHQYHAEVHLRMRITLTSLMILPACKSLPRRMKIFCRLTHLSDDLEILKSFEQKVDVERADGQQVDLMIHVEEITPC